jgi:hypothetical protein
MSRANERGGRPTRARLIPGSRPIDETWAKTNMAPLRGWAPKGQRLRAKVPFGHWKTMTFLAALRSDRIEAPWVFDGPINGDSFRVYVEKVLIPTLMLGDVVVLDNLGSHKGQACAPPCERAARMSSSYRPIVPISTRSNRCSQSSNICSDKPPNAPSKRSGRGSERSSTSSRRANAQTTSPIQDMRQCKVITL